MKSTNKLIVLGLLLGLAGGATGSVRADQESTPTEPAPAPTEPAPETPAPKSTKPVEQQLNGRVVAVDKNARTVTVQVNNQTYVLQTSADTKFTKAGKTKTLEDLLVGEDVSVTVALKESASGRVEIAVVSVDLPKASEAQGGRANGVVNMPAFVNLPNPANVGGNVRSPH